MGGFVCSMRLGLFAGLFVCFVLLLVAACDPIETADFSDMQNQTSDVQGQTSDCDRMSEGSRKGLCQAMEAEDPSMCEQITGRFRDECVVVLAELVYDTSLDAHCNLAKAEANKKICAALINENIDDCFSAWSQGAGVGASLSMRDCIDLTSRKTRNKAACDVFIARSSEILNVCGDSSDCVGQWIDGAQDHAADCKVAVEEALSYD